MADKPKRRRQSPLKLDMSFNEPQPVHDDELTGEVVRAQLEMAEYLDMIVLPPDATMQDVQRELDRLGNDRSIDVFEWKRLEDLVRLREEVGGRLFRTKDRKEDAEPESEPVEPLALEPEVEVRVRSGRRKQKKDKSNRRRSVLLDPCLRPRRR